MASKDVGPNSIWRSKMDARSPPVRVRELRLERKSKAHMSFRKKKTLVLNVARLKCDLRGVLFRIVSKISNI